MPSASAPKSGEQLPEEPLVSLRVPLRRMGRFDATSALALAERALQQSGEFGLLAALAFYFVRPQLNFGVMLLVQ